MRNVPANDYPQNRNEKRGPEALVHTYILGATHLIYLDSIPC